MGRHITKKPPKGVVVPDLRLFLKLKVTNPNWTRENGDCYWDPKQKKLIDRPGEPYYIKAQVEVQILTVHFERNSMRVRYTWNGKVETENVDATPFFKEFTISKP